jgi:hypothetical protein
MRRQFAATVLVASVSLLSVGTSSAKPPTEADLEALVKPFEAWSGTRVARPFSVDLVDHFQFTGDAQPHPRPCLADDPLTWIAFDLLPTTSTPLAAFREPLWGVETGYVASRQHGTRLTIERSDAAPLIFLTQLWDAQLAEHSNHHPPSEDWDHCWARVAVRIGAVHILGAAAYSTLVSHSSETEIIDKIFDETRARGDSLPQAGFGQKLPSDGIRRVVRFLGADAPKFAAALYRTGGIGGVLKAVNASTLSTSEILHPETPASSDRAAEAFRRPVPPRGWTILVAGQLGEMGTQAALADCVGMERSAGEGWRGDKYLVVTNPNKDLGLLWSTEWESITDAAAFEAQIKRRTLCWHRADTPRGYFRESSSVTRANRTVMVTRGMGSPDDRLLNEIFPQGAKRGARP